MESIQQFAISKTSYEIDSNEAIESINSRKRIVSNRILILDKHAHKFNIAEETTFILQKFHEYEDFIGNHITDLDYLEKSKKELRRPLDLIDSKLSEMMLKLFE